MTACKWHPSHVDHLVANFDEAELEDELRRILKQQRKDQTVSDMIREALNRIDDWQAQGIYEVECAKLRGLEWAEYSSKDEPLWTEKSCRWWIDVCCEGILPRLIDGGVDPALVTDIAAKLRKLEWSEFPDNDDPLLMPRQPFRWQVDHYRSIILHSLIGGGTEPVEATKLVEQYVDGRPAKESVLLARKILECWAMEALPEKRRTPEALSAAISTPSNFVEVALEVKNRLDRCDAGWQRLRAGLNSSDAKQRARFEAFFATIKNKNSWDDGVFEALNVLESPHKSPGRKRGHAYSDDAALLQEMKAFVRNGDNPSIAARKVAHRAAGGNMTLLESKVKRLETAYRAKMALRGSPVEK